MTPPAPWRAGLLGLCPRCGSPTLYCGVLRFSPACATCGLDFSAIGVGDGPAAFLVFIVGAIVVVLAGWLELSQSPPFWLHLLLWPPLALILTVGLLRFAKALLLNLAWRNDAGPGQLRP